MNERILQRYLRVLALSQDASTTEPERQSARDRLAAMEREHPGIRAQAQKSQSPAPDQSPKPPPYRPSPTYRPKPQAQSPRPKAPKPPTVVQEHGAAPQQSSWLGGLVDRIRSTLDLDWVKTAAATAAQAARDAAKVAQEEAMTAAQIAQLASEHAQIESATLKSQLKVTLRLEYPDLEEALEAIGPARMDAYSAQVGVLVGRIVAQEIRAMISGEEDEDDE